MTFRKHSRQVIQDLDEANQAPLRKSCDKAGAASAVAPAKNKNELARDLPRPSVQVQGFGCRNIPHRHLLLRLTSLPAARANARVNIKVLQTQETHVFTGVGSISCVISPVLCAPIAGSSVSACRAQQSQHHFPRRRAGWNDTISSLVSSPSSRRPTSIHSASASFTDRRKYLISVLTPLNSYSLLSLIGKVPLWVAK